MEFMSGGSLRDRLDVIGEAFATAVVQRHTTEARAPHLPPGHLMSQW